MQGELYYSMDEAFARKPDVWKDVNLYSGNGDGTLFYPGRPQIIGGTKQIPIESIRLKLIREGLEDYEYLAMLTKLADTRKSAMELKAFCRVPTNTIKIRPGFSPQGNGSGVKSAASPPLMSKEPQEAQKAQRALGCPHAWAAHSPPESGLDALV